MTNPERKLPWLNRGDRLVLGVVFVGLVALLGFHHALRAGLGGPRPKLSQNNTIEDHLVDINRAKWWELQALQGIGEKRAKGIVAHRGRHGRFKSVNELARVRGIGEKTLKELSPYLTAGAREGPDERKR